MQRQLTLDVLVTDDDRHRALRHDVETGMTAAAKRLPPIWFYDETGSRLFDEITRLPEYYLTRAERAILAAHAREVALTTRADTLVEIGSGTSAKTRLLLDELAAAGTLRRVVLLDISEEVLREAAAALAADYGVDVHAIVGDFREHLPCVPRVGERRLWAFLGSTLGNLGPRQRQRVLFDFQTSMFVADHLLLGTDLVKDTGRLLAAYDDAAGVTAAFNRNVLAVLNRELSATFDPALFAHRAAWNGKARQVEMRLAAQQAHVAQVRDLRADVRFDAGEEILTETCAKFTPGQVAAELDQAGLVPASAWHDDAGDFQLTLARPYC